LTGLKLSSDLPGFFGMTHQDLLLTFETDIAPFYDASLSYIVSQKFGKSISTGGGVEFAHLISVDESQTTPISPTTRYTIGSDTTSHYYTFRGAKVMGRLSIDPKITEDHLVYRIIADIFYGIIPRELIGLIPLKYLGPEDFKLYYEGAILGVKNYPANDSLNSINGIKNNLYGYDSLFNKFPIMIGFNVPTFKLLDLLSVEVEWYGCPYPDNYKISLGTGNDLGVPLPDPNQRVVSNNYTYEDNWKWSVYLKKMLLHDHFGVILQCARDHMRVQSLVDESKSSELETSLEEKRMWWWMAKLVAQF
jgi:hypothetical protein